MSQGWWWRVMMVERGGVAVGGGEAFCSTGSQSVCGQELEGKVGEAEKRKKNKLYEKKEKLENNEKNLKSNYIVGCKRE